MTYKPPRRPHFFYTTAPLPCPYVAGRTERKVVTEITGPDADALHDRLSRAGFRRSHNIAYAPVCPSCQACVPIRIPVATFQPDRTLRRVIRANGLLEGFEVPARATAEQFQLFQRYQQARHGDGDMATMSFYDYRAMVEDTPIDTLMVEFRDPDDRMVGACLADRLGDGLSAVYSFFAPGLEKRSLGNYAILWLIERAKSLGLPYVYLGYWVPESRKMAYKSRFRPSEVLIGGTWRMLTDAELGIGPDAVVPADALVPEFGELSATPEPDWLIWAREIQAIAQTGLAFTKDPYDIERYEALRGLAARIVAAHSGIDAAALTQLFAAEQGYTTPKLDVRGAVFNADGHILMVREVMDAGRWTLPGGWADVNQTPSQCVVREVLEESGFVVRATKLAAVWDRAAQGHTPPAMFSIAKLFFICALEGGEARTSLETSDVGWFAEDAIPADLSMGRTLPQQIVRMFAHWRTPGLATEFE